MRSKTTLKKKVERRALPAPGDEVRVIEQVVNESALAELGGQALGPLIDQERLAELWARTPPHAIRQRQGGGGKIFSYVPHGYVDFKLNKIFGGDWDMCLLPVFAGNVFHLQIAETTPVAGKGKSAETKIHYYVAVALQLTVRVRDLDTLEVIGEITKEEFGSASWFPENEFGDSLKSAISDALKRCAMRLGIASDLYYDDDSAAETHERRTEATRRRKEEQEAAQQGKPPADYLTLILRSQKELGLSLPEIVRLFFGESANGPEAKAKLAAFGPEEISKVWEVLSKKKEESNGSSSEDGG